jgi:hypothetical protein
MGLDSLISKFKKELRQNYLYSETSDPGFPTFTFLDFFSQTHSSFETILNRVAWAVFLSKLSRIFPKNLLKELTASSLIFKSCIFLSKRL